MARQMGSMRSGASTTPSRRGLTASSGGSGTERQHASSEALDRSTRAVEVQDVEQLLRVERLAVVVEQEAELFRAVHDLEVAVPVEIERRDRLRGFSVEGAEQSELRRRARADFEDSAEGAGE